MTPKSENILKISKRLMSSILLLLGCIAVVIILGNYRYRYGATAPLTLLIGAIGGFVGLQRRLKQLSEEDLDLLASSHLYTFLAPFVGGVLALLLYIIFHSGLVQGDLFPNFLPDSISSTTNGIPSIVKTNATDLGESVAFTITNSIAESKGFASLLETHAASHKDYAKVVVWSFIAGYSERFVIDVISRFEAQGDK